MFKQTLVNIARAAAFTTAALVSFSVVPAMASAPMVKTSAPGYFRIMLGDFEVTALSDGTVDLPVDKLLAEDPAKTNEKLAKVFLKAPLETSVNGYLINTGSKLVLIDTGAGSLFGPTLGKLASSIKASGYEPSQVDEIYITHFHADHVGGLVANDKLVFPNAVVRAEKRESDAWLSKENMDAAPEEAKGFFKAAMASLNPYVAAKKFKPFTGSTALVPGIRSLVSIGHTAGHTSYVIESKGEKLIVLGDLIHVAAVQFDDPTVTIQFDSDQKVAEAARKTVFNEAVKEGALVAAEHIQFPGLGHLKANGKAYTWIPVNYTRIR